MNMITNPTIFWSVFKIFFYIILVGYLVFGFFIYAIHGNWAGLWDMAKSMLIVLAVLAVLTFLGVLVMAIKYRGKYVVLFEMDEYGIVHMQEPRQFRKAQKMGAVAAGVGLASGRLTTAGAGMMAASKNKSVSDFSKVRRVKPRPLFHVIKVNEPMEHNQIYVPKEDFDFVYQYIKSHCPNLK